MVAATAVTVAPIGIGAEQIPAGNLQEVLSTLQGKLQYALTTGGETQGQAAWAAQKLGAVHYHLQQIGESVGYEVPSLDDME